MATRNLFQRYLICLFATICCNISLASNLYSEDSLMIILREEVDEHYQKFHSDSISANFIGLEVNDVKSLVIESYLGSISKKQRDNYRQLSYNIKVGTPESGKYKTLNKLHLKKFYDANMHFEGNLKEMRMEIKNSFQNMYKNMCHSLTQINNKDSIITSKEASFYSKNNPLFHYEVPLADNESNIDIEEWSNILNEISSIFTTSNYMIEGIATLKLQTERRYSVNSDSIETIRNYIFCVVTISSSIIANNGEEYPLSFQYPVCSLKDLPTIDELKFAAQELKNQLSLFYNSQQLESYSGPVLFGAKATGVIMHEIIGHRLEPLETMYDSIPMWEKLSTKILPDFLTIYDDPTIKKYNDISLVGHYLFDEEGSPAKKVECIKGGVLKSLLNSRTSYYNGGISNGHGRAGFGKEATARQANLFIEHSQPTPDSMLRQVLIEEINKKDMRYGYYIPTVSFSQMQIKDISGLSDTKNHFPITIPIAYKVYADGSPDSLVCGGTIILTVSDLINSIKAMGTKSDVYNGYCGAKSGLIPVSLIAPQMLVSQISWNIEQNRTKANIHINTNIPNLVFSNEQETIFRSLEDEMQMTKKMLSTNTQLPYFVDFIIKNEKQIGYRFSGGKCVDSLNKNISNGNLRIYLRDKDEKKITEGRHSLFNLKYELPEKYDYLSIRRIFKRKVQLAYVDVLKRINKKQTMQSDNITLCKLPPKTYLPPLYYKYSNKELFEITNKLSLDINKLREFENTTLTVTQKSYNDYRLTSEGQKIHKTQTFLHIIVDADIAMKNGVRERKKIDFQLLDNEIFSVREQFKKELKEFIKYFRNNNHRISVKNFCEYNGPVLFEDEAVKSIVFSQNLLNDILNNTTNFNTKKNIGECISNDLINVKQISDSPYYNERALWGYEECDMDGVKPKTIQLIEGGILKNRLSGRISHTPSSYSTGNEKVGGNSTSVYVGIIHLTYENLKKQKAIKTYFLNRVKKMGYKYAYIIRRNRYESGLIRVNIESGKKEWLDCQFHYDYQNSNTSAVSFKEYITQERNPTPCSFICPQSILCENVKLRIYPTNTISAYDNL